MSTIRSNARSFVQITSLLKEIFDRVFEIEGLFSKEKGQVPILNYVPFHSTRTPVTKQGIRFTIFVVKQKIASYCV